MTMQADDEPGSETTISHLERQRQGPWSFRRGHTRSRWGMLLLLAAALLAGGELAWYARPLFLQRQSAQATPLSSVEASPTAVSPRVLSSLMARPFHFPTVPSLATCPVSVGRQISPDFGLVAGAGPVYLGPVAQDGTVTYAPADQWADGQGWGGMLGSFWTSQGTFAGPVLVRGQRLDAVGEVRFDMEPTLVVSGEGGLLGQLQLGIQAFPAAKYQVDGMWHIRFNAPGCYGLQLDWLHGTERIVIRAIAQHSAGSTAAVEPASSMQ
jgi:hypothetical protein